MADDEIISVKFRCNFLLSAFEIRVTQQDRPKPPPFHVRPLAKTAESLPTGAPNRYIWWYCLINTAPAMVVSTELSGKLIKRGLSLVFGMQTKPKRAGSRRWLPLWQERWNVRIDSARETFGADGPFAGVPWLKGPEEGPTFPRAFHLNRAHRNSKSSSLLTHCGETAFVGICAATQDDRVARLAMEYGIGLSAACQEQRHQEQETFGHPPSPSLAI